eukprot:3293896-Heterocapsa_arctica.AAC.1
MTSRKVSTPSETIRSTSACSRSSSRQERGRIATEGRLHSPLPGSGAQRPGNGRPPRKREPDANAGR